MLRKTSIKGRLTLIVLLASVVPLLLLGQRAFEYQKRIIQEEVTSSHLELSNTLAYGIYEKLEYTRRLLNSLGTLEAIRALNAEAAEDLFNALMRQFPLFKIMYLINSDREIVASTDPNTKLPADWLFSKAITRSYQGSLSEVYTTKDTAYMTLESVIRSTKHSIIGVLISEVNLSNIGTFLKTALRNSRSQGLIFDEKGTVIAKSSSDVKPIDISLAQTLEGDITKMKTIDGEPYLITAVSLKKFYFYQAPNWTIVLQIPEKTAFLAAHKFREQIRNVFAITAILAIVVAFLLSRGFTVALANLINGARQMSKGNFDCQITPMSADEIGELTSTFDEMRINLQNTRKDLDYRILQLSTLYKVGQAISSVLDFKKLQNMILEIVVKVIDAEKGSLMLVDDGGKVLTIGVAIGLSDDVSLGEKIEMGNSVAGSVIESGKPLFVKDALNDKEFLKIKRAGKVRPGTLMCVPLIAKEKLLGSLNVSRSEPNTFTEQDFELFTSLSNQAAIAIDNARLYRYAVTDEMTKIYNHRYFQQRLDEELQRADRYESNVSLIMLDVDHFKNFNDTYGHLEGDRVLKTVTKLIEKNVREIDIAARYGGEEFAVICPEKTCDGAMAPAERIRTAVEGFDFRIAGKPVPITISLGIAEYPGQTKSKKELIMKADVALYYSKEHGRNQTTLFNPIMSHKPQNNQPPEPKKSK